ncbi:glycoside hydrolase family 97 N-terminal domain-containing protein [Paraglaciecola aquimarina]|uniref:Glycoside hydrolase family 97 N-terminal domain-containing protein n=1 Tax=Paraglaciecola aquimarina TaxID=1235557 RepID=A0ABU3STH8_9ALTE|nr:glycoside hydrolase family 97 N-terminal domain-containing protein [Paraglaciecola aquimarina]MDU0353283.1 glycoside hydrolase family 97 N-terminal domain-containing protein [Paraglaciecola aquimarina]
MKLLVLLSSMLLLITGCSQDSISLLSPDGTNSFVVLPSSTEDSSGGISFLVKSNGKTIIQPSVLKILSSDLGFKGGYKVLKVEKSSIENQWSTRFGELSTVPDNYNQATIYLDYQGSKLNLIIRAYNEGVAFSYEIPKQQGLGEIEIDDELISYRFDSDYSVWSTPKREPGKLTAQGEYRKIPLSKLEHGAERPLVIEMKNGLVMALAEARLVDYARLSFNSDPNAELAILSSLDGKVIGSVQDVITGAQKSNRSNNAKIKMSLPFKSPWRVVMIANDYAKLLEQNYLIQNLNDPSKIKDDSWIVLRKSTERKHIDHSRWARRRRFCCRT